LFHKRLLCGTTVGTYVVSGITYSVESVRRASARGLVGSEKLPIGRRDSSFKVA
jgi:hypothetical protein